MKEETQFLIDMFFENGHKRTFQENLVKDYNVKRKNNDSYNYTISYKIPWVLNIGPKVRKEFKRQTKTLLSDLARTCNKSERLTH